MDSAQREQRHTHSFEAVNGKAQITQHALKDMDDWLITPGLVLTGGKTYVLTFLTYSGTKSLPETIEVFYGKTPTADGMTESLMAATDINHASYDPMQCSINVTPAESGTYYIGIHGISMADSGTLYVYDFKLAPEGGSEPEPEPLPDGTVEPPFTCDFSNSALPGWTVLNENNDERAFEGYQGTACIVYSSKNKMDDWLITPPLKLDGNASYNLTFLAYCGNFRYPERLEVKLGKGKTAADMTQILMEPTVIDKNSYYATPLTVKVTTTEPGVYYIGFHGISDANMDYLHIDDVNLSAGVQVSAPGPVTELKAVSEEHGALSTTVSFNAPATTLDGKTLSAIDRIEVNRDGESVKTFATPTPGQALSLVDEVGKRGDVVYSVIAYNEAGAGLEVTDTVHVGFSVPVNPATAKVVRNEKEGEVTVSWDPVTKDVNGLTFAPGDITYMVGKFNGENWNIIKRDLTETSYTFQAVPEGEQEFVYYAAFAVSVAGNGVGKTTEMIPVGTPYKGIHESFPNKRPEYKWGLERIEGGNGSFCTDSDIADIASQDADNGFFAITGYDDGTGAELLSGLISLKDMDNPGISFYLYNLFVEVPDTDVVTVSVRELGSDEYTDILTGTVIDLTHNAAGWGKVSASLAAYAGKTIEFKIKAITDYYIFKFFDNIVVGSLYNRDLQATSISAPFKVMAGESYNVTVGVANNGIEDLADCSVELYVDGEKAGERQCGKIITSGAAAVSFTVEMPSLAAEPVEIYAKAVCSGDQDSSNDKTETVSVAVEKSTLPVATGLKGRVENDKVMLEWAAPSTEGLYAEPSTETFESGNEFASTFNGWTFIDLDKGAVGGFSGMDIPGITAGSTMGSFWIWNTEKQGNASFMANSGSKYLFSLFREDGGPVDDWAISPILTGNAQTISFYARSYSSKYPEKVEVYYSTGSLKTEDFKSAGNAIDPVPDHWTYYEYQLPEGAKYFAIRSCAANGFMLMVDDVRFTAAESLAKLELTGYNVYRGGVKVNAEPVAESRYTDSEYDRKNDNTYVVTALFKTFGESAASEEVTVKSSGIDETTAGSAAVTVEGNRIIVSGAAGRVSVVSSAGITVYAADADGADVNVAVAAGVYVVTADSRVVKVIVR